MFSWAYLGYLDAVLGKHRVVEGHQTRLTHRSRCSRFQRSAVKLIWDSKTFEFMLKLG